MNAFVTGATGFIGNRLVRMLLEQGVEVHALCRRPADLARPIVRCERAVAVPLAADPMLLERVDGEERHVRAGPGARADVPPIGAGGDDEVVGPPALERADRPRYRRSVGAGLCAGAARADRREPGKSAAHHGARRGKSLQRQQQCRPAGRSPFDAVRLHAPRAADPVAAGREQHRVAQRADQALRCPSASRPGPPGSIGTCRAMARPRKTSRPSGSTACGAAANRCAWRSAPQPASAPSARASATSATARCCSPGRSRPCSARAASTRHRDSATATTRRGRGPRPATWR